MIFVKSNYEYEFYHIGYKTWHESQKYFQLSKVYILRVPKRRTENLIARRKAQSAVISDLKGKGAGKAMALS